MRMGSKKVVIKINTDSRPMRRSRGLAMRRGGENIHIEVTVTNGVEDGLT